jgi:hypothetical protein
METTQAKEAPKADPQRDPEREALLDSIRQGDASLLGEDAKPESDPPGASGSPEAAPGEAPVTEPRPEPTDQSESDTEEVSELEAALQPARPKPAKSTADDRLKTEWAKLEAEKSRLAQERLMLQQQRDTPRSSTGYTPEDYEAVAKQFENEGNDELANQARRQAAETRQKAHVAKLQQAHGKAILEAIKAHPELNNPESGLFKRLDGLLKSRPVFFSYPEGVADAIESAVANERAAKTESLEKEVSELRQKLASREKLLHPTQGGPPAFGQGEVEFDKLTPEKQKTLILRALRAQSG